MPVIIRENTAYGRELAMWDAPKNKTVRQYFAEHGVDVNDERQGKNRVGFEEFPRMLYRAAEKQGRAVVFDLDPLTGMQDEQILQRTTKTVQTEAELRLAQGQGWCLSAGEALEAYQKQQDEIANLAAEAAYQAERLSERARREYAEAQAEPTHRHVVDVAPRKRRGRPRKAEPVIPNEPVTE